MSEETATVELELTEQQLEDALRVINTGEIELKDRGYDDKRVYGLTNVWAQLYRGGRDAFGDDTDGEEVSSDA